MKRLLVVSALFAMAACAQHPPPPVATNSTPPPPPPPPPPAYTVYFDYNSTQIGPAGRDIIRLAADGFRAGNYSGLTVTGFTDPSGGAGFNQRLSLRRANAVTAVLVQDGVPQSAIVVSGQGETSGGAEIGQDRRADILLGGPAPPSS